MRTAMILTLMAVLVTLAADQPARIELPKSGSVNLASSVRESATHYVLSLKTSAEAEISLAVHDVPLSDKPPTEWRALLACDENPNMVVALLEVNEFSLMLIQYDLATKAVREHHIAAPRLLADMRASGGTLKVNAPNRITLAAPNQESRSWSVEDGTLIEDGGNALDQGQTLQIGSQRSQAPSNTPAVNTGPAVGSNSIPPVSAAKVPLVSKPALTPSEEPASSTLWSIITVLIMVATGLLWLLVKKRK
jgi:hypothetical protein